VTMFPHDDPRFRFEDDPRPPEPDTAVLQRVVARGRQRLFHRRALFGGAAVAIVAVLLSSGVAVAQHRSAGPGVAVQPPNDIVVDETTTTIMPAPPTSTTTGSIGASEPLVSTPTTVCPSDYCMHLPPFAGSDPTPSDFSGYVTVDPAVITAGDNVDVLLMIRNDTDHVVNAEGPLSVAVVCANDLSPDGHTSTPLHNEGPDANIFWVIDPAVKPGDWSGIGPMTVQTTAAEIGTVTCEGVLVTSNSDSGTFTSTIVARLDKIPAATYTVLPVSDSPSTTTSTPDTSTTTPETTVPPQ
jgi:hypothetical protein